MGLLMTVQGPHFPSAWQPRLCTGWPTQCVQVEAGHQAGRCTVSHDHKLTCLQLSDMSALQESNYSILIVQEVEFIELTVVNPILSIGLSCNRLKLSMMRNFMTCPRYTSSSDLAHIHMVVAVTTGHYITAKALVNTDASVSFRLGGSMSVTRRPSLLPSTIYPFPFF